MSIAVHLADCVEWLTAYDGPLFDSCVTDPPYHLSSIVKRFGGERAAAAKVGATGAYSRASRGFMGKAWDTDVAFRVETWQAVFKALKPGAHLIAFNGTRTYHRMACAIEDAGFEIRDSLLDLFCQDELASAFIDTLSADQADLFARLLDGGQFTGLLAWVYATGFPKSHNLDGAWEGWGTALKPAFEPICFARKPLVKGSIAASMAAHGTGAINIDACRIGQGAGGARLGEQSADRRYADRGSTNFAAKPGPRGSDAKGRFPANVLHDGSADVLASFPDAPGQQGAVTGEEPSSPFANVYGNMPNRAGRADPRGDQGSAARFFYSAKAGPLDRIGSPHATIKPVDLMRWLCRLVTPPAGVILEPFAGSGTTGIAAMAEGFGCTMLDIEPDHVADIQRKLSYLRGEGRLSFLEHDRKAVAGEIEPDFGALFEVAL